jgi:hypothetical protein
MQKWRNLFLQTIQAVALALQHRQQPALRLNAAGGQPQERTGFQRRAIANIKSSVTAGLHIRHVGDGIPTGRADAGRHCSDKQQAQHQETIQHASELRKTNWTQQVILLLLLQGRSQAL